MDHLVDPRWRKSTYSGVEGNSCVELGQTARAVLVRDTTDRDGTVLTVPADSWHDFLRRVSIAFPEPR